MKHVVTSRVFPWFTALWDELVKRLEQTGERIVRAQFTFHNEGEYKAVVWTERDKVNVVWAVKEKGGAK